MTDSEIAEEAKRRYPYNENETDNRINKLSSKRRRFIEGAKWMRDVVKNLSSNPVLCDSFYCWEKDCNLPKCEKACDVCRCSKLKPN